MPQPPAALPADPTLVPYAAGILRIEGQSSIDRREAEREAALAANNNPVVVGLASHVRECWSQAYNARRTSGVEERMLKCVRQRRGEYDPEILAEIKKGGGSEIYMMLTSNKCRSAAGWLRDVLMGNKDEKPWTISPTPLPDLPPAIMQSIQSLAQQEAQQYMQVTQQPLGPRDMELVQQYVKDRVIANAKQRAKEACEQMELKMEDQLVEGGYQRAMVEFIEDIVTFPSAFMVGPIVRNKPQLKWVPTQNGDFEAQVSDQLTLEWERADPFMVYPAPHSTNVDDGYLIRRHRLTRSQLNAMLGVEGYSEDAIRTVLDEHGKGGLHEWLIIDSQKAQAEGKSVAAITANPEATIDALQFWGSVQGKMLVEWGMDEASVPDQAKDYPCEVWLIGQWVIKAQLNSDPLGRKPVYKASYEEIPGVFWGHGVADLCRDAQTQCNTAARSMANNMGLGATAQVAFNVDRLPSGEDLTQMFPGKVWQFTSDPYGSSAKPVDFFAVPMISGELMQIYNFFSSLADEHTGIPRYMAGDAAGSGALRTSSGMSMLMQNAGKGIKQVVANVDTYITTPLIDRLWYYNMKFGTDASLKGDIKVVARGANMLVVKETQQQRANEFLQIVLNNQYVAGIVGEEVVVDIIRENAKAIGLEDKLPSAEVIRARMYQQQQAAAQQMQAQQQFQMQMALAPSHEVEMERGPDGAVMGMKVIDKTPHVMGPAATPMGMGMPMQNGRTPQQIMSNPNQQTGGQPITDNFSPMRRH